MYLVRQILADRTGATSFEYAFLAALIAVGSLVAIQGLGASVDNSYTETTNAMADARP
jgi:pilus assembly protein Flp/PilA